MLGLAVILQVCGSAILRYGQGVAKVAKFECSRTTLAAFAVRNSFSAHTRIRGFHSVVLKLTEVSRLRFDCLLLG
jgi:hypothetical protein